MTSTSRRSARRCLRTTFSASARPLSVSDSRRPSRCDVPVLDQAVEHLGDRRGGAAEALGDAGLNHRHALLGQARASSRGTPRPAGGTPGRERGRRAQAWQCPRPATAARRARGCGRRSRTGTRVKPVYSTGMTGQSSGRGMCVTPNECHSTMSVSTTGRSCAVHCRQARPAGVLVRVVARGPPLLGVERRDPQVVRRRRRRAARRSSPGRPAASASAPAAACRPWAAPTALRRRAVGDAPRPAARRVDVAPGRQLASRAAWPSCAKALPTGFPAARVADGHRVDLEHRVVGPVDLDVEPHVEEVLVVGRGQTRRHHLGVRAGVAVGHRHGRHDPGELHLELHGAVEVEVPVEPVLVVADGGDGAHHQPARPAHLGAARDHVDVLPEDAVVLLVHADGVGLACAACRARRRRRRRSSGSRPGSRSPSVSELAMRPEAPLAGVEGALPRVHRAGVPVGHDHLAHRGPVEERAHPAAVLVADVVEDQALERVHADPQRPLLPAHEVALDREARALGLGDLERLEVGAQRPVVLGVVAARVGREGDDAEVDHLEHLAPAHVDEGQQALERAGVAVVVGRLAQVGQALGDPAALLVVEAERARRPGVDLDQRAVDDAPAVEGGVPLGVLVRARACAGSTPRSAAAGGRPRTTSQRSTSPRVTETTASTTSASGPCRSTSRTRRSTARPGSPRSNARTTSLGGSHSADVGEAQRLVAGRSARPLAKTISRAALISSPVRGASGCSGERCGNGGGRHWRPWYVAGGRGPPTMPAMDDAADRAARSARELARRIGHRPPRRPASSSAAACPAPPRSSGAGGDSLPLDTLPFFPRYTAAGHRAQGWSVDVAGQAGPRLRRPLPPLRGHRRRRGGPPPAHGHRRRLHHRHPDRRGRRHPRRPHDGLASWWSRTTST